jgi:hypothetical protein
MSLNTAWASASHCGCVDGGFGKLRSAAIMAATPQKHWSSFPSSLVWLLGMKSAFVPTWNCRACETTSLYWVSPVRKA